jgi:DNA invertase Pin-like site-specific DNA recombinase
VPALREGAVKIGYARVSTDAQSTQLQVAELERAGCERIYRDQAVTGVRIKRPGLGRALADLQAGDVLVVTRLDRLGRSLSHLIDTVNTLHGRGVGFQSLSESIDTTSATGTLVFHVLGALAQFERALIRERTSAGLAAAKSRGVKFGRPPRLSDDQVQHARALSEAGKSHRDIARLLGVSRMTIYRILPLTNHPPASP